jgi:hypothetical protein
MLGTLLALLVAEKSGFQVQDDGSLASLREFADRMTNDAMESMKRAAPAGPMIEEEKKS